MFWDAEIALARFEDPGLDVGQILRVPYELFDEIGL